MQLAFSLLVCSEHAVLYLIILPLMYDYIYDANNSSPVPRVSTALILSEVQLFELHPSTVLYVGWGMSSKCRHEACIKQMFSGIYHIYFFQVIKLYNCNSSNLPEHISHVILILYLCF